MKIQPTKPLCDMQRRIRIRIISKGFRTVRDFALRLAEIDGSYKPYHRDYWWRGLSVNSKASQLMTAAQLLGTSVEVLLGRDEQSGVELVKELLVVKLYE